jgi:predicted ATP-grasp superfamily ATP-dependent carboligase
MPVMNASTVILIGHQRRLLLPALQAARGGGIRRRIVVGDRATRRLRWSTSCSRHVLVDLQDERAVTDRLVELATEFPQAVLVPCDCPATKLLHRVGPRVPLRSIPHADPELIDLLDDKSRFQRFCEEHRLPVPKSLLFASRDELAFDAIAAALGLPFVVKPTRCSGSLGVVVVRNAADLEHGVLGERNYPAGAVLVQRYVPGCDVDVDLYAVGGQLRAATIHHVRGHWMHFGRHAALEALAAQLCEATHYSGPMNLDARIEQGTGRVFLIESNPRLWASLTAPATCGLNFLREGLDAARPGQPGPSRFLSAGSTNTRHPLLRPAEWGTLLADRGERGRLLRSSVLDPYALVLFGADLPALARRAMRRLASPLRRVPGARGAQQAAS